MNKQKCDEILGFVREYIQENGISPSVREICEGTNISSTSTVHRYLHKLKEDGRITMHEGRNRTIVMTEKQGIPVIWQVQPGTQVLDPCNIEMFFDCSCMTGKNYLIVYCQKELEDLQIHKGDFLLLKNSEQGVYLVITDEDGEISVIHRNDFRSGQILGSLVMCIRNFAEIPEISGKG